MQSRSVAIAVLAACAALFCTFAHGQSTYYVVTNGNDNADGTNWVTALLTISNAVAKTVDGDTVMVSNGTYDITAQVDITNGITVQSVNGATLTTIDAGYVGGRRVLNINAVGAVLDGFTVTRGRQNTGAGIYLTAGTVRNCTITNNLATSSTRGGGVYLVNGILTNCVIVDNEAGGSSGEGSGVQLAGTGTVAYCTIIANGGLASGGGGGGISISAAGTVANCLIADNLVGTYSGGGIYMKSGNSRVLNCTIVGNKTSSSSYGQGGGIRWKTGVITNTIVYYNKHSASGASADIEGTNNFAYSCSPDLPHDPAGSGNITNAPEFVDLQGGDYRQLPGSPCIDAGTNLTCITVDLEGSSRPADGDGLGASLHDMGAYEAAAATAGVFRCNFIALPTGGSVSTDVVFTASVMGPETNGLYYWWDFENDGTNDEWGAGWGVVTNTYTSGVYSVLLTVSNDVGGVTNKLKESYILVTANTTYVSTNGLHQSPFNTWAKAASNIQAAIDMSDTLVLVSNGVFSVTNEISVTKGIVIESVLGAEFTTVDAGYISGRRVFQIDAVGAVLDGFTVTGGRQNTGAGIYLTAGTVRNCTITNNLATGSTRGGGVYLVNGILTNCVIVDNEAGGSSGEGSGVQLAGTGTVAYCTIANNGGLGSGGGGGGISISAAGTVANCLITGNLTGAYSGGGIYMKSGNSRVLNCTIVGNMTASTSYEEGGGIHRKSGVITNTIVYYNTQSDTGAAADIEGTNNFAYCCSPDLPHDPAGSGNITNAPEFVDRQGGDYHQLPGSPSIDAGTNLPCITADLEGNSRPADGDGDDSDLHDMGAYEAADATGGVFRCNFLAVPSGGSVSTDVVFTAYVMGPKTNGLYYWWDYENDGTNDAWGATASIVTNPYTSGAYSVLLTVSNGVGDVTNMLKVSYILVTANTTYVSTNGLHQSPFDTLAKAASNIQAAVNMSDTLVLVSNGVYSITSEISITKAITVQSVNGADLTAVDAGSVGGRRVFKVDAAGAALDGFTIMRGIDTSGGGIYLGAGTVRNCIITNNTASGSTSGGGVYMLNGVLQSCTIVKNVATGSSGAGSGVRLAGTGMVDRCIIDENGSLGSGGGGGGLYVTGAGIVRNCLVTGNLTGGYGGAGIFMTASGSRVQSCTVVGNRTSSATRPGGIRRSNGVVTNTIIYYNVRLDGPADIEGTNTFGYSCSPDLTHDPAGTGNITNKPMLVDTNAGDYSLADGSPCVNAGIDQAWMLGGQDLAGNARIGGKTVDIGAYEPTVSGGSLFMVR